MPLILTFQNSGLDPLTASSLSLVYPVWFLHIPGLSEIYFSKGKSKKSDSGKERGEAQREREVEKEKELYSIRVT